MIYSFKKDTIHKGTHSHKQGSSQPVWGTDYLTQKVFLVDAGKILIVFPIHLIVYPHNLIVSLHDLIVSPCNMIVSSCNMIVSLHDLIVSQHNIIYL